MEKGAIGDAKGIDNPHTATLTLERDSSAREDRGKIVEGWTTT